MRRDGGVWPKFCWVGIYTSENPAVHAWFGGSRIIHRGGRVECGEVWFLPQKEACGIRVRADMDMTVLRSLCAPTEVVFYSC